VLVVECSALHYTVLCGENQLVADMSVCLLLVCLTGRVCLSVCLSVCLLLLCLTSRVCLSVGNLFYEVSSDSDNETQHPVR